MVVIVPKVYAGWYRDLRRHGQEEFQGDSLKDGKKAWITAEQAQIENYRVRDAEQLIDQLWKMYFEQEPDSLVYFGSLFGELVKLDKLCDSLHLQKL